MPRSRSSSSRSSTSIISDPTSSISKQGRSSQSNLSSPPSATDGDITPTGRAAASTLQQMASGGAGQGRASSTAPGITQASTPTPGAAAHHRAQYIEASRWENVFAGLAPPLGWPLPLHPPRNNMPLGPATSEMRHSLRLDRQTNNTEQQGAKPKNSPRQR